MIHFSQTAFAQPRNKSLWFCPEVYKKFPTNKNNYTQFYTAVSAGVSGFGTSWIGKAEGYSFVLDLEAAYFFKRNFGAGLKYNSSISELNIKDIGIIGKEIISFFGPAMYGRFGTNSVFFTTGAGVGLLNCTFIRDYHNNDYDYGEYNSAIGGFISAGAGYKINRNFAIRLNIQSIIGSLKNMDYRRNPTGIESTIGIFYNF